MAGWLWKSSIARSVVAAALVGSAACDLGSATAPDSAVVAAARVAYVIQEGGRPALYVQNADGTGRTRIHFSGAQSLPGNLGDLLVQDDRILALGPLAWSPDGRKLAVVVTLAYDQSELVVLDADGGNAREASLNSQIIMTAPDWSPDGTKLAYGMSTQPRAMGVQLFVTDLAANAWRQVTTGDPVGTPGTDVRWSSDGGTLYLWQTLRTPSLDSDWLSRISAVDPASGGTHVLVDSVAGMVQEVSRTSTWALVLRTVSQPSGQDGVRDLVRRPLVGLGPELKLVEGNLWWARASSDDRGVTVVADADASPSASTWSSCTGRSPRFPGRGCAPVKWMRTRPLPSAFCT